MGLQWTTRKPHHWTGCIWPLNNIIHRYSEIITIHRWEPTLKDYPWFGVCCLKQWKGSSKVFPDPNQYFNMDFVMSKWSGNIFPILIIQRHCRLCVNTNLLNNSKFVAIEKSSIRRDRKPDIVQCIPKYHVTLCLPISWDIMPGHSMEHYAYP